jgi:hypothetical protein
METQLNEWLNPIIGRDLTEEELSIWSEYKNEKFYPLDFKYLNEDEKLVAISFFAPDELQKYFTHPS